MISNRNEGWRLWPLPMVMGIVPLLAALLSAVIAMRSGAVPSCMPLVEGCTSISATGRYAPANYVFRGLLLPYCTMFALYWMLMGHWLRSMDEAHAGFARWIQWTGLAAAVTLAVYVVTLGSEGKVYELMRRYGIYFFFLATYVAQLLTAIAYRRALPESRTSGNLQLAACAFVLAAGLLNLFAKQIFADGDAAQNVTEWNATLVMFLAFWLVSAGWRATGYRWRAFLAKD